MEGQSNNYTLVLTQIWVKYGQKPTIGLKIAFKMSILDPYKTLPFFRVDM